ncbi:hypothetical protein RF11_16133 [Thelohanellus kitauei]|uniref:Uncharacterized protein n=1 Tax=Thelohanellus kitauei TaxID=669202 RepID=A0A0C2MTH4_THEKT|nr:hypothetical protein RF11_16133 [Thelohanellus kitauei]
MDFIKIITGYEAAARCFLQIDDSRAKAYYMHAVDVFLENGYIEKGIQCCVEYGFECQQQLGNKEHAEEFYTLADKLRNIHNLSHSCVIKQFVESKYGRDIDKVWHEIQKVSIVITLVLHQNKTQTRHYDFTYM